MAKPSSHLRLVSSSEPEFSREAAAERFRDMMADHIRAHAEGTNINQETLLTTNYLNHFNEVIMLLEMLPTAPAELAAELANWQHKTYEEHFLHSGFREKDLAIAAYKHAPTDIRNAFDSITNDLSGELSGVLHEVQGIVAGNDLAALSELCMGAIPALQSKLETAIAIVNGEIEPTDDAQAEVCPVSGAHQAAVDEIFE
ncbi:MAG: hypothetical protein OEM91_13940 [Hyphomicrobiales bacterium]|nr:hypothetical protein [Hyphomicrobiales bacterium]